MGLLPTHAAVLRGCLQPRCTPALLQHLLGCRQTCQLLHMRSSRCTLCHAWQGTHGARCERQLLQLLGALRAANIQGGNNVSTTALCMQKTVCAAQKMTHGFIAPMQHMGSHRCCCKVSVSMLLNKLHQR